jgi:hypothetical protein
MKMLNQHHLRLWYLVLFKHVHLISILQQIKWEKKISLRLSWSCWQISYSLCQKLQKTRYSNTYLKLNSIKSRLRTLFQISKTTLPFMNRICRKLMGWRHILWLELWEIKMIRRSSHPLNKGSCRNRFTKKNCFLIISDQIFLDHCLLLKMISSKKKVKMIQQKSITLMMNLMQFG